MNRTAVTMLMLAGAGSGALFAEPESPPAGGQNIETVLNTLNETLEENRTLRKDLEGIQNTYREITVENNALKSQFNRLQTGQEATASAKETRIEELTRKLGELQKVEEKLVSENNEFSKAKSEAEELLVTIRRENESLKNLLATSILESERDEYLRLIQESQAQADHAAKELSNKLLENEILRTEYAESAYSLANLLYAAGDYKNAVDKYERALALNPSDSWSHHNLGIIYDYYLDEHENAMMHYDKYLKLKPIEEEANEIRERVIELELSQEIVPDYPLKLDFSRYSKTR